MCINKLRCVSMVMPIFTYGVGMPYYTGNMYQDFKFKYGYGPMDFNEHPTVAGYPTETSPKPKVPVCKDSRLRSVVLKKFG